MKTETPETQAINKQVYASIEKPLKTSLICRLAATTMEHTAIAVADGDGDEDGVDGKGKLETNTGRDWMIDNYFVAQSMGYSGLQFTQPAPTASKRE